MNRLKKAKNVNHDSGIRHQGSGVRVRRFPVQPGHLNGTKKARTIFFTAPIVAI